MAEYALTGLLPVIRRFDLTRKFLIALSPASGLDYEIHLFAADGSWVSDVEEFDTLFSATPVHPTPEIPGLRRDDLLNRVPTEAKETLTLLIDSSNLSVGHIQLVIDSWNLSLEPREPEESWRDKVEYQNDAGEQSWSLKSGIPSTDGKLAATFIPDGNGSGILTHLPHDWTLALVDPNSGLDALTVSYTSIKRLDVPFDFELRPDDFPDLPNFLGPINGIRELGTLSVQGLGINLDLNILWTTGVSESIILALYDDTLILSFNDPPYSANTSDGGGSSSRNFVYLWNDDGSFHAGSCHFSAEGQTTAILGQVSFFEFKAQQSQQQNYLALQRDPELSPAAKFEFRTQTPGIVLTNLTYQETEKLTTIGEPRVPYDPGLDETTQAKDCEQPYQGCLLVGSEEDLRLELDIDWGVFQDTSPLCAGQCTAAGRRHLGSYPATTYDPRSDTPANIQFFKFEADATGEAVDVLFEAAAQGRQSRTGKVNTPFALSNPRVSFISELDGDITEPPRVTVTVRCDIFRNDIGNLAIRTVAEVTYANLRTQSGPTGFTFNSGSGNGVVVGNRANYNLPSLADVIDITPGGNGYDTDPCHGQPVLAINTIKPKPVRSLVRPILFDGKRQTLTWETDLGETDLAAIKDIPEITLLAADAEGWSGDEYPIRSAQKLVGVTLGTVTNGAPLAFESEMECTTSSLGDFYGNVARTNARIDAVVDYVTEDIDLNAMTLKLRPQGLIGPSP